MSHYQRWKTTGEVPTTPVKPKKFRRITGPCLRPNCDLLSTGSGYCKKHYARMRMLMSYGLDGWDDFDRLWRKARGRCQICRTKLDPDNGGTHIDHCHLTGEVRGVLCHGCNHGLGAFQDEPKRLLGALVYLQIQVTTK